MVICGVLKQVSTPYLYLRLLLQRKVLTLQHHLFCFINEWVASEVEPNRYVLILNRDKRRVGASFDLIIVVLRNILTLEAKPIRIFYKAFKHTFASKKKVDIKRARSCESAWNYIL